VIPKKTGGINTVYGETTLKDPIEAGYFFGTAQVYHSIQVAVTNA
jgi:hypothetical protein